MIYHAEGCGGDRGRRYTACAVTVCGRKHNREDRFHLLRRLGETWLSHVLFVYYLWHPPSPPRDNQVMERDSYRCVVSGIPDPSCPNQDDLDRQRASRLAICHIFRRSVAVFDGDKPSSRESLSARTTFDILRRYANIPVKDPETLEKFIGYPSNCFTLNLMAYQGFDEFLWSLRETQAPNTYDIMYHALGHGIIPRVPQVTFKDHSATVNDINKNRPSKMPLYAAASSSPDKGIPLPDPLFLRIHNAIAGVLHASGAAVFLDEFIKDLGKGASSGGVICGDNMADWLRDCMIRTELESSFQDRLVFL
ncbi:hypothetical protein JAAARDRAFT_496715 [Jaapia argillacea MUCL 33604]|uniref:Uncharacterized protein n=1 Tax=Jaapia argillacea MUCL 33604 TaxID=933084 RepID=A0A067PL15_9AGAM|nr:hypothetical protein JAAARDRAFT_496715 [Jaapia argillacea MUCL 33604]